MSNKSIWPNDRELQFVVLTGDYGSGKTSWALNVDPVLKGKGDGRTLYCDFEGSATSFKTNYEFDHLDMPQIAREEYGDDWTVGQMFNKWWELVDDLTKNKNYTVLVIDDFSPLQEGAFANARGKDTMEKWMWVKAEFRQKLKLLQTRVQTIVVVVHLRNKKDNSKEKEPKGIDVLNELASLRLYLHRDPNKMIKIKGIEMQSCPKYPYPSGIVLKSRLEQVTDEKDEFGDYKRKPLIPDRIPVCTPGAIRKYMANPSVIFSDEEQLPDDGIPGLKEEYSEEEIRTIESQQREEQIRLVTLQGRADLIKALIESGKYTSENQVLKAAKALGITYTPDNHQQLYNQLLDYKGE